MGSNAASDSKRSRRNPASVYIGSKKLELDLEGQMEAMRKSIDVRHEPVELTLRCDDRCGPRIAGNR